MACTNIFFFIAATKVKRLDTPDVDSRMAGSYSKAFLLNGFAGPKLTFQELRHELMYVLSTKFNARKYRQMDRDMISYFRSC